MSEKLAVFNIPTHIKQINSETSFQAINCTDKNKCTSTPVKIILDMYMIRIRYYSNTEIIIDLILSNAYQKMLESVLASIY